VLGHASDVSNAKLSIPAKEVMPTDALMAGDNWDSTLSMLNVMGLGRHVRPGIK
jgi:hypothetical protein